MTTSTWKCAVLALLCASVAFSQSKTMGSLSGSVIDPSNSAVPGARITVTGVQTGSSFAALTDERGEYLVPLLPPGLYDVKIEKAGFAPQSRKNISVTVGEAAVADARLTLSESTR